MKKLTPTQYHFTVEERKSVLIKNRNATDAERVETILNTTYYYLDSSKYFKVKAHINSIVEAFEQDEVRDEKLTMLTKGLARRLKKGES